MALNGRCAGNRFVCSALVADICFRHRRQAIAPAKKDGAAETAALFFGYPYLRELTHDVRCHDRKCEQARNHRHSKDAVERPLIIRHCVVIICHGISPQLTRFSYGFAARHFPWP